MSFKLTAFRWAGPRRDDQQKDDKSPFEESNGRERRWDKERMSKGTSTPTMSKAAEGAKQLRKKNRELTPNAAIDCRPSGGSGGEALALAAMWDGETERLHE